MQTTNTNGEEGFLVRMTVTDAQEASVIANAVASQFGWDSSNVEVTTIGPDWGASVVSQSLIAFAVALVLLIIYIGIRFEFKMGFTAVVVLLHDLIVVIGIYALFGREFTPNAVAALLSLIGYSLYDTVVVFHRIADNAKDFPVKTSFYTIANHSLNQVFIRSINTTVTSLLPVVMLLLFGGETLKDFAFALTIGLVIGCYSSIAVGTPLFAIWKTREQKYAKAEKRYPRLGQFEFQRSGATMAGALGNSKSARMKTAAVAAANVEAAITVDAVEMGGSDGEQPVSHGSNEIGADGRPLYQQVVRNPKKAGKKRR